MVVCTAGIIAALHYGQDLVVPLALAVLISFLLNYPVTWVQKLKIGHAASVVLVMVVAFSIAGTMIWIAGSELTQIVIRLPEYQQNIRAKLDRIEHAGGAGGSSAIAKAAQSISELGQEFSQSNQVIEQQKAAAKKVTQGPGTQPVQPVPVRVVKQPAGLLGTLGTVGAPIGRFVGTLLAVIILTLFILLNRSGLRNRLFRLGGKGRITIMTTAMDDAAQRVSRYLLTQGLVNTTYGVLLGTGLYFIGLPYAVFFGCIAIFLRFIPYLGTFVAGISPFIVSLAVFDGWKRPLLTLGLFIAVEGIISSFVEPWLYATKTGISSLAILISATFWTLLWGPIGLVISTPLTVLLLVLGRHIPQMEFLYVLLGDEPVLTPEAHYYQRLLAFDEDEARDVADKFLKENPVQQLYDMVVIPALGLAEQDRHQDQLDEERQKYILQSTRDLIEELWEQNHRENHAADDVPANNAILCIPARDEADEVVGLMLAQCLQQAGYRAETVPIGFVDEMLSRVRQSQPDVLFISALPPFAITHARSLCRRARQVCKDVKVVIALWGSTADRNALQKRLGAECSDYLVHTIAEAELQVRLFAGTPQRAEAQSAPAVDDVTPAVSTLDA
jgi:predicted PurR-regulated permease PerM/CheY-like chemotaxis protein